MDFLPAAIHHHFHGIYISRNRNLIPQFLNGTPKVDNVVKAQLI